MLRFTTLIVDDNAALRESVAELLRTHFPAMAVVQAGNSDEALDQVFRLAPDLILMDIKLPGPNGLQVTQQILSQPSQQAVVVILSGNDLPEYRDAARRHGAEFFLSKSLSSGQDLLQVVQSVYSRKLQAG